MDVFRYRDDLIDDYRRFVAGFIHIRDQRVRDFVERQLRDGALWPEPLIQLNPFFARGAPMRELVDADVLHPDCARIFSARTPDGAFGAPLSFHRHQVEAFHEALAGRNYVLTTGTGSGKSLAYIVPIVDHILRHGSGRGIKAILVYPMNALANSQVEELRRFLHAGFPEDRRPVSFARYTGQETDDERIAIQQNPPDILLTNYVMLEYILTRPADQPVVDAARDLRFLVLDELHTYRGRQGADVSLLCRRVREVCKAPSLLHVGTSATMGSGKSWAEQQQAVATVASQIFGAPVLPSSVIGETLNRTTPPLNDADLDTKQRDLQACITGTTPLPTDLASLRTHPLARWIEAKVGVIPEDDSARLVRAEPKALRGVDGLAHKLSVLTEYDVEDCVAAIRDTLLRAYDIHNDLNRPAFAFRLHQFVSKGERVYASPEPTADRHITLRPQQYVPGDRQRHLLPLLFCRECGQDYYVVWRRIQPDGLIQYVPRDIGDTDADDPAHMEPGFLHIDEAPETRWPDDIADITIRLPDDWTEFTASGKLRLRRGRNAYLPRQIRLTPLGIEADDGDTRAHFAPAPFRLCLSCGVSFSFSQRSDFGKLASLGTEGRSSATTILGVSAISRLRAQSTLPATSHKLLSFTDNRQDAALQAGHFNDYVMVTRVRTALARAVAASADPLTHDVIAQRVFDELRLPPEEFMRHPEGLSFIRQQAGAALRGVLSYLLYIDQRRGWRLSQPNLEQVDLLRIDYAGLDEVVAAESLWRNTHEILATAKPEHRERVARIVLHHLRRELAIDAPPLEKDGQERIVANAGQHLGDTWQLPERLLLAATAYPCPAPPNPIKGLGPAIFLSSRGGIGRYLARNGTFPDWPGPSPKLEDRQTLITQLLSILAMAGLVTEVSRGDRNKVGAPGYRLNSGCILWTQGAGEHAFEDPIRHPQTPDAGLRVNDYFRDLYRRDPASLGHIHAHEHTAQVASEVRAHREEEFREARLPVLFCSPTMELGVDIASLNVVNLRNVPPTPANYAQRSGRAGRSGQPAFVYTYCSAWSPHDQYFFRRPLQMVAGRVSTPRIDLENDDLVRAHVHAVWLTASGQHLGATMASVLDTDTAQPTLELRSDIVAALHNENIAFRAHDAIRRSLGDVIRPLLGDDDTVDTWISRVLAELPVSFDRACDRWRSLYRAALDEARQQLEISIDASRSQRDRKEASARQRHAQRQLDLLLDARPSGGHSDFYPYRYLASEGFLPGYNFPRLPLHAYLPGRRDGGGNDEYLSRPRFLAISEFGPGALIYHEGARYEVERVMHTIEEDSAPTSAAARCSACGYLHPARTGDLTPDLCESCHAELPPARTNLFRMRHVIARHRETISSDEEERRRAGFELQTAVRFAERDAQVSALQATVLSRDGAPLYTLKYGAAATVWRLNLGPRRRAADTPDGVLLDVPTGRWISARRHEENESTPDTEGRSQRVIPFVEDHKNCLVLTPSEPLELAEMATLEAALKSAIQLEYQLEPRELAAEPLPSADDRRHLLFYEASEGGAGVLAHLVSDPDALQRVARRALELTHYDPDTLVDRDHAPGAEERCEAACYDCLMSYYNQRDHELLMRELVKDELAALRHAVVRAAPRLRTRQEHREQLERVTASDLERRFLTELDARGLRLPTHAQLLIEEASCRPDFYYEDRYTAIFVDGPPHDTPEQRRADFDADERLLDIGRHAIRFRYDDDWERLFVQHQDVFGTPTAAPRPTTPRTPPPEVIEDAYDRDLFEEEWLPILDALDARGVRVYGGDDIQVGGRNVGVLSTARLVSTDESRTVHLFDASDPAAAAAVARLTANDSVALALSPTAPNALDQLLALFDLPAGQEA